MIGDWSPDSGYNLGRQIIKRGVPHAVFAANDQMALGVMRALKATLDPKGILNPGKVLA